MVDKGLRAIDKTEFNIFPDGTGFLGIILGFFSIGPMSTTVAEVGQNQLYI